MSSYRSTYVPWNKNSLTSNYSSSAKSDSPSTTTKSKYESGTLSRPSSRAENKIEPEKPMSSKLGTSYRSSSASAYSTGNPRDRSASREPSKYGSLTSASVKDSDKPTSVRDKYTTTTDKPSSVREKYATVEKSSSIREKYATQEKPTSVREKYSSQTAEKPSSVRDKYASPGTGTYPGRTDIATRIKTVIDKKDTPPVSFRPLSRTGTRSRDPSPAEREKTDNYRLYPRSYTRSTSREPERVTSPTPKYGTKTASASKEDLSSLTARYGTGRTSRAESREDLTSRLRSTSGRSSREDLSSSLPRYSSSRHSSKEDLSIPSSTKYINSRFLPRNTVEKSYSAYTKPVTSRSASNIEDKRRSRDNLLVVLQTHASLKSPSPVSTKVEDKPIVKSPSTPNSVRTTTTVTVKKEPPKPAQTKDESEESETEEEEETETETEEEVVMETVTVVTRGTSPTPPSQSTFIRNRRADMARALQKDITRPKKRKNMVDKEIQSDRMDDTARYSRFGSSSTVAAAPWSSYLDLKYNSPRTNYSPVSRYSNSSYSYKTKDSTPPSRSDKSNESRSREPSVNLDTDRCERSEKSVPDRSMSEKSISDKSMSQKGRTDKSQSDNSISHKTSLESSISGSNKTSIETPSSMSNKASIESSNSSNKIIDKPPSDATPSKTPVESVSKMKKKTSSDRSSSESINSIPRNNSSKSINQKSKSDAKSKEIPKSKSSSSPSLSVENSKSKSNLSSLNSKQNATDAASKKQLPPPVPKGESPSKSSGSVHITSTQNKDFRKSVLNMNTDGKLIKKSPNRSSSVSSDSEPSSVATCAEVTPLETSASAPKLSTSKSLSKLNSNNSSSKLPQKLSIKPDKEKEVDKTRRSPSVSSESSSTTSSSEDDVQKSKSKTASNKKKLQSAASSRTSILLSSADELSLDRPAKPPPSPRTKTEGPKTEAEAKSFLMRALAPVTNFFKVKHQDSTDKVNWMLDSGSENTSESAKKSSHSDKVEKSDTTPAVKKSCIKHVESGERAWWLEENTEPPEGVQKIKVPPPQISEKEEGKVKFKFQKLDSGDEPWWMTDSSEIPEGVEKMVKNGSQVIEVNDGKNIYKIRRNESGKVEWWLDSSEGDTSKSLPEKGRKSEFLQPHRIRHIDSGERAWWLNSNENIAEGAKKETEEPATKEDKLKMHKIRHQDSGERAWWLMSHPNIPDGIQKLDSDSSDDDLDKQDEPLGDRASPEGLEMPREIERDRLSPYDNVPMTDAQKPKRPTHIPLFISRHTNIDEILGGGHQMLSPLMDRIYSFQDKKPEDECEEIDAGQVRIHDSTAQRSVIQPGRIDVIEGFPNPTSGCGGKLDDAALQLYKDGDYGSYLDLEASISEQQEEFDGFQTNKKNSIVLRTQLSVRVHTIIEKLLTSEGRELRRALFSLKQIFQEDKDLVHEFVQNDGLACLIKVGSEADQNYQNYILRALGQVMLYVDGMNGVMDHNQTVQWLYTLIASKFRLVVKTALKLLLVFVEYTDSNCMLLIKAVNTVDGSQGLMPWSNIMRLLKDFNAADTELLIYAMTLVNKCLNGIPDQDTYYDQTDALEEQGIEGIIQRYMSKQGTDLDLLQQFQIYEAVLQHEDGEDKGMPLRHLDESIRKTLRNRKSLVESTERRKSRRHSTGNTPLNNNANNRMKFYSLQTNTVDDEDESSSSQSSGPNDHNLNGSYKENNKVNDVGVTPALRRRRERAERQRSFIKEQQESAGILRASLGIAEDAENGNYTNNQQQRITNGNQQLSRNSSRKDLTPLMNAVNKLDSTEEGILKKPWVLQMMYGKPTEDNDENNDDNADNTNENDRKLLILKRENTVKDLTQKLASQNILHSPSDEGKINRIGDMSGLISKAKEGLAKSKSKADVLKSPTSENVPKVIEVKKSENELRWEELVHAMNRPLNLCDMDFTDLQSEDEADVLAPIATTNGIPPPPPPLCRDSSAPPPPPIQQRNPPPFPTNCPMFGLNMQKTQRLCQEAPKSNTIKKNKKTVKLFWKEVRDDPISLSKLQKFGGMIWDELNPVTIDTQKLEHLFESRAKDLISKKQQEMNKNKEIIVLDHKRSNAINIGMTKLPPPRSIKTAILKMDATIMNREGIEKLLTMLPTEEERTKIQDAQAANPDLPLGSAEQFLLTLASISELPARLKLWAFKLDFENSEREIAEPLMDLKQGIELLKGNKTFRGILSTLLSIGIFLNGNEVKGFQIEYLAKVPEVKDTVHKHSLLHHLCHIVMEKFPEATDLYSEIGAITRASKIDFDELALNIHRLESDCKASWDHLKLIGKHDGSTMMKVKMSDFLADCAERIILLGIVHRRVMTRYHKFLLWLGIPLHRVADTKPNEFCRIVSEFALEYRTTRERVLQQLEKKANHRERNKTRGKMITEVGKFKSNEDRADAELRQLLGSDISDVESMQGTLPWRRQRKDINSSVIGVPNGNLTDDGDDEILESLVKTATKAPSSRTTPRERKRTRHADRKSLRRTLKNGLSEEEKKHLAAYIKGY